MTQTEQGDLTQSVSLSYRDYNPENGGSRYCSLWLIMTNVKTSTFGQINPLLDHVSHSSSGCSGLFSINKRVDKICIIELIDFSRKK